MTTKRDADLERQKEVELERFTRLRGFRHGVADFYAGLNVNRLRIQNDWAEANYVNETLVDLKTKELWIVVVCMTRHDLISHLQVHMHAARRAGASPEEILEAINLVGEWLGSNRVANALEAWRATFRPDIPTIDRVAELR